MDDDKEGIFRIAKGRVAYSYASIADTFFWGEKRQYLPFFQGLKRTNDRQNAAVSRGLQLVDENDGSRKNGT